MTPLKHARKKRKWRLSDVCDRVNEIGRRLDTGNLSRIERGKQTPSPEMAESLAKVFMEDGLSEMQIIYPERYQIEATQ